MRVVRITALAFLFYNVKIFMLMQVGNLCGGIVRLLTHKNNYRTKICVGGEFSKFIFQIALHKAYECNRLRLSRIFADW